MNEELRQQLMEFVYGLLDEDEANALCERITSDPEVARAYSKTKLQCDLVGRAARVDSPNVAWIRPGEVDPTAKDIHATSNGRHTASYRRVANWCVGIAASALVCLVGSTYWMSSLPDQMEVASVPVTITTADPVQVVLTGPSKLHAEASNPFTIQVASQAGTPVSTILNYRVYDSEGAVSWFASAVTDEMGNARFAVAPTIAREASRLEITTDDDVSTLVLRELESAPDRFATYLRMDRPLYQPGEQINYRSVTLSQFGLRADREVSTFFEVVDSNDEPVAGSTRTVDTERGVGKGGFELPDDLPDGQYTLVARSPDQLFDEQWRDFHVRRYRTPKYNKKLEFANDSYTNGDQVDIDFSATDIAGKPLANVPLKLQASLDAIALETPEAKTDASGNSRFSLKLPDTIDYGDARVSVSVSQGVDPAETISKDIPINLGKVNVDFYPEGGDLVAGLPSRVYFYGRDPLGEPTHLEGQVVDSNGEVITDVVTTHEGRGVFSLTPVANEQYRLMLAKPAGVTKEIPIPLPEPERFVTVSTGSGVFDPTAPIRFTLNQDSQIRPLIVAAYCRGAMVGQRTVGREDYVESAGTFSVYQGQIAIVDDAQGVIRLTVFDSTASPPEPVAERLVYRRVSKNLDVNITPDSNVFVPGQSIQLSLAVQDERQTPVAAALGIAIVDDAVLTLADDKSVRMPTFFHLLTEIDAPEQIEDANFYLADEAGSAAALDSLLGTQGWRRFKEVPAMQLAQRAAGSGMGGGGFGGILGEPSSRRNTSAKDSQDGEVVPVRTTGTVDAQQPVPGRSNYSFRSSTSPGNSLARSIVLASLVLVALIGVTSLPWWRSHRSVRILAGIIAIGSLFVGTLNSPKSSTRVGSSSDVAVAPSSMFLAEEEVELDDAAGVAPFADDEMVVDSELFMSEADDLVEMPNEAAAFADASKPSARSREAIPQSPSVGDSDKQYPNQSVPKSRDKAAGAMLGKDKKTEPLAAEAESQPEPQMRRQQNAPQPTAEPKSASSVMLADANNPPSDRFERKALTRMYSDLVYHQRKSAPLTEQPSSTIFWHPLFVADETGKADVYFDLPDYPANFRVIVEAHGAERLGAGELLINSQTP